MLGLLGFAPIAERELIVQIVKLILTEPLARSTSESKINQFNSSHRIIEVPVLFN